MSVPQPRYIAFHVDQVLKNASHVVSYVFKPIRNGRFSYDESVMVLPRTRAELEES